MICILDCYSLGKQQLIALSMHNYHFFFVIHDPIEALTPSKVQIMLRFGCYSKSILSPRPRDSRGLDPWPKLLQELVHSAEMFLDTRTSIFAVSIGFSTMGSDDLTVLVRLIDRRICNGPIIPPPSSTPPTQSLASTQPFWKILLVPSF